MSRQTGTIDFLRLIHPEDHRRQLMRDVRTGLLAPQKTLPPKYFYDARGSELFDQITQQPEYYPTRTETSILEDAASAILNATRPDELVEIGAGIARKTLLLLDALVEGGGQHYVPLDVSEDALQNTVDRLSQRYPQLGILAVVADFEQDLSPWNGGGNAWSPSWVRRSGTSSRNHARAS